LIRQTHKNTCKYNAIFANTLTFNINLRKRAEKGKRGGEGEEEAKKQTQAAKKRSKRKWQLTES